MPGLLKNPTVGLFLGTYWQKFQSYGVMRETKLLIGKYNILEGKPLTKKHLLILFGFVLFLFSGCIFQDEAKQKFDNAETVLDSLFGENGTNREIREDIELPASIEGVTLTWTSAKTEYLTNDGKVNRMGEDVEVLLTVEMKYGKNTREVQYQVVIKALIFYHIYFDSNAGSEVEKITAEANTPITKPEDPVRPGYSFIGWYESEANEEYVFDTMPERNVTLYAQWDLCTEGLKFNLKDDGSYEVTGYEGTAIDVYVPRKYYGKAVTSIAPAAFKDNPNIKTVYLQEGFEKIGEYAFSGCTGLRRITFEGSLFSIGEFAFEGCSSLDLIVLPETITNIGDSAFTGCTNFKSILLPESLTTLGANAFAGCTTLTIYVESASEPSTWDADWNSSERPVYYGVKALPKVFSGMQYLLDIERNQITITRHLYSETTLEIPSFNEFFVREIGKRAFEGCGLEKIFIPDSVTYIGDYAFINCPNLIIYVEASSKPEGWSDNWNPDDLPVYWGAKPEDIA